MKKLRITIGNKSYDVTVEELGDSAPQRAQPSAAAPASVATTAAPAASPPPSATAPPPSAANVPGAVHSPMAGTVKAILVKNGDSVAVNQPLVVLDAMKMENQIVAPTAGRVSRIEAREGQAMREGDVLLVLE